MIECNLSNEHEKASFLVRISSSSSQWRLVSASLCLYCMWTRGLDDEAVRTAVALRLGTTLCVSQCTLSVSLYGVHSEQANIGLTLSPWQEGKPLAWDVTVIHSFWLCRISLVILSVQPPQENVRNMQILQFQPIAFTNVGLSTCQPLLSYLH